MLNKNQHLGKWGEKKATEFLKKKGYKILFRNYKNSIGEIDIIAKIKKKFVFVEVKTRSNNNFGIPEEAVNFAKQKKLLKTVEKYILENKVKDDYQIDVIAIEKKKNIIRHIKNAVNYF